MKFKQNQRLIVKARAPHHRNRVGFFQFFSGKDTAVLTDTEVNARNDSGSYFAVDVKDLDVAP